MTTGQEGGNGSTVNALLASLATLLMALGAWILRKLNKEPRPKELTEHEYNFLKSELEEKFRRDMQPIKESLDRLSAALTINSTAVAQNANQIDRLARMQTSEVSSLHTDMQEMRGEFNQLSQRVARQGGVLRGLEERFNAE